MRSLPLQVTVLNPLLPAMTYTITPRNTQLARYGITEAEARTLQLAYFTTNEMIHSLGALLVAYDAAGYADGEFAIDVDGKRKLVRNGWELITVGWRRLYWSKATNRWSTTFVPFGTLLAPTETWQALIFLVLALMESARVVLHRQTKVIGMNGDAHTSAFKFVHKMQIETHTLCFPHIVRGPSDMKQRRLLNGSQDEKDAFGKDVATPDVTFLHLCQTTEQALALLVITMDDWRNVQKQVRLSYVSVNYLLILFVNTILTHC
jgi:hypothetical protein